MDYTIKLTPFEEKCHDGSYDEIKEMLKHHNPADNKSRSFGIACYRNDNDIIQLLYEDGRIDPSTRKNNCIRTLAARGNIEMVTFLLQDPRVDPHDKNNDALRFAKMNMEKKGDNYDQVAQLIKNTPKRILKTKTKKSHKRVRFV